MKQVPWLEENGPTEMGCVWFPDGDVVFGSEATTDGSRVVICATYARVCCVQHREYVVMNML